MDPKPQEQQSPRPGPEPGAAAEISPKSVEASAAAPPAPIAVRDEKGRFPPGVSGNPNGRPPGIPNRNTEFVKLLSKKELRWCWELAKKQASKGKLSFLEFLLERGLVKQSPEAAGITLQVQQNNHQSQTNPETHVQFGAHLDDPAVRGALADVAQRLADRGGFTGGNGDVRG